MIIWTSSVPTVNVQEESTSVPILLPYIYSIHNISTTDVPCQWKRKATEEIVTTAAEMFPKKNKYVALNKEPSDSDRNWLFEQLQGYGQFTGIHWLMAPEPDKQDQDLPVLERVLSSNEFRDARDKKVFFLQKMIMKREHILKIADITKGQRKNDAWHRIRRGRLTASNFGSVLQAKK